MTWREAEKPQDHVVWQGIVVLQGTEGKKEDKEENLHLKIAVQS